MSPRYFSYSIFISSTGNARMPNATSCLSLGIGKMHFFVQSSNQNYYLVCWDHIMAMWFRHITLGSTHQTRQLVKANKDEATFQSDVHRVPLRWFLVFTWSYMYIIKAIDMDYCFVVLVFKDIWTLCQILAHSFYGANPANETGRAPRHRRHQLLYCGSCCYVVVLEHYGNTRGELIIFYMKTNWVKRALWLQMVGKHSTQSPSNYQSHSSALITVTCFIKLEIVWENNYSGSICIDTLMQTRRKIHEWQWNA